MLGSIVSQPKSFSHPPKARRSLWKMTRCVRDDVLRVSWSSGPHQKSSMNKSPWRTSWHQRTLVELAKDTIKIAVTRPESAGVSIQPVYDV
jgi:hypothetical protein